ncbi:MAG: hypothetical protein FWH21_09780, partial [Kiritimatiellaeota bacterium]|nr:hypothetical protein [Kiritimatiellota bacterium]
MKKLILVSLLAVAGTIVGAADWTKIPAGQAAAVAMEEVKTNPERIPDALAALKETKDEAKARVIVALTPHAERADVKDALLAALGDASEIVRVVALRAAMRAKDPRALPIIFDLCFAKGEDGRCAVLTMAVLATEGTEAFLFDKMKQEGPPRAKAIEWLA